MKFIKKIVICFILLMLGYTSITNLQKSRMEKEETLEASSKTESTTIKRVVDGDTVIVTLDDKDVTVRLIGVDTPESVHADKNRNTQWGKKASDYTKAQLKKGTKVFLKYDVQKEDKYGRTLAYLYTKKSCGQSSMYNLQLVRKGMARAICYEPNHKHKKLFEKAQKLAKKLKKGFWKSGYESAFPK